MATAIYIVLFSRNGWWVDLEGVAKGPFTTREIAMAEAVALAAEISRRGRRSEVQVSDPEGKRRIIYQSAMQSGLSRAAAILNA